MASSWKDAGEISSNETSDGQKGATTNSNDVNQDRPASSSESAPTGQGLSPPFHASAQPGAKYGYGAQGGPQVYGRERKICCCSPKAAVITMATLDLISELLWCSIATYECNKYADIMRSMQRFSSYQYYGGGLGALYNYYLGMAIICGILIVNTLFLYCGVCSKSKCLCWTSVVFSWIGRLVALILLFVFYFFYYRLKDGVGLLIIVIIEIGLMVFETYAVGVFLRNSPNQQQQIRNQQPQAQRVNAPYQPQGQSWNTQYQPQAQAWNPQYQPHPQPWNPQYQPQQYYGNYPGVNYGQNR